MRRLPEDQRVAIWRARIRRSQALRKEQQAIWDKNLAAFEGRLIPDERNWHPQDPWVSIEKVHSSIRAALPTLLYSNPKWSIEPKKPIVRGGKDASWELARSKELWLQHVWNESEGNKHARVAILSAFLAYGALKCGYSPTFADDDMRGEFEVDGDGNYIIDATDSQGRPLPRLSRGEYLTDNNGDIIFDDATGLPLLHPGTLQREEFFVEYVPYDSLLFDTEGGNVFTNHRYIVEEWVRPLSDIKADTRFSQAVRKRLKANAHIGAQPGDQDRPLGLLSSDNPTEKQQAVSEDEERVRGYDIYDFDEDRYLVLADEVDNIVNSNDFFMLDDPMPAGMEHGPYRFLKFNEIPGRWYPKTDVEGMAKVELEYCITRSQMLRHRNQSRSRYLEVRGAGFDAVEGGDLEREKFASGPDGVICHVGDANGILPARKDALDGSYFQAVPNIDKDFNDVAGMSSESRGVADSDTATQASLLQAGADIRNNDRRDNQVQTFLAEIGRALLQSAQANADGSLWVKISRPNDPQPFEFREINPEDLEGEFEVTVAVGSTAPKNSQLRVQMYERLLTVISQNPIIAASPTLMRRVFEALDINDDNLIEELKQIGQQALGAMQKSQGAEQGNGQALLDQIMNQFGATPNVAGGAGTGAPAN